jgi:hypothetical protein
MTNEQKRSGRDRLTLTTNEGKSELTEQELSRVAGGSIGETSVVQGSPTNCPTNSGHGALIGEFAQALGQRA